MSIETEVREEIERLYLEGVTSIAMQPRLTGLTRWPVTPSLAATRN